MSQIPVPGRACIEVASGGINGLNQYFSVSTPYIPGSTAVFLNGILLKPDSDSGWTELGSNKLKLKEAPLAGDTVLVFFRYMLG